MKNREMFIQMIQRLDRHLQPMSENDPSPAALAEILRDLMVLVVEDIGSDDDCFVMMQKRRRR